MFLFGHVGLTWGGVLMLARLSRRLAPSRRPQGGGASSAQAAERHPSAALDYRFVLLGSMLPDLIDKPLGVFIFRKELGNGRIFAHGLLFNAAILLAALAWKRRAAPVLLSLAVGGAAHLALDRMWMDPRALLWPLRGWRPERQDVGDWVGQMLEQLFSDPYVFVSEVAGALIVAALARSLVTRRGLGEFARTGRMAGWSKTPPPPRLADREERPQQVQGGQRPAQR